MTYSNKVYLLTMVNTKLKVNSRIVGFVCFALSLILFFYVADITPIDQDEFAHYHYIMCTYYNQSRLGFMEDYCNSHNLFLLNSNISLPILSSIYNGSFPVIYYYPLFLISRTPLSARFVGFLFICLQAFILSKLFKIRYTYLLLGLSLFFPYFFQHIIDTGPVSFQITSIYLIYCLAQKWVKTKKLGFAILIALIIFVGVWIKLTYFWLLPGITLILLNFIFEYKNKIIKNNQLYIIHLLILIIISLVLFLTLFLSTDTATRYPYYDILLNAEYNSYSNILEPFISLAESSFSGVVNPLYATHRSYEPSKPTFIIFSYDLILYGTIVMVLIWSMRQKSISVKKKISSAFYLLLFILTSLFIGLNQKAWAMHHIILAYPFLILSYLMIYSKKMVKLKILKYILILFVLLNYFLYIIYPFQKTDTDLFLLKNDYSKVKIHNILEDSYLASKYNYIILDNGFYFYQALFGRKNQGVFDVNFDYRDFDYRIGSVINVTTESNRKILLIFNSKELPPGNKKNYELFNKVISDFNLTNCSLISNNSVWQILVEKDLNKRNICFNSGSYSFFR